MVYKKQVLWPRFKTCFTGLIGYVDSVRYVNELDYVAYEDLTSISPKTKKLQKLKLVMVMASQKLIIKLLVL